MDSRPSRHCPAALLTRVQSWLTSPGSDRIAHDVAALAEELRPWMERTLLMHGVGPYLYHHFASWRPHAPAAAEPTLRFLAEQKQSNQVRISRMHEELAAILYQSHRQGLRVMPLKGSLLGPKYYPDPALRPMADLDLLVVPQELPAVSEILGQLGYEPLPADNRYALERHRRFLKPDNREVVATDREHPDNPRPVEVHTELRRALWGDRITPDFSRSLWRNAQPVQLLSESAWAPSPGALLEHCAVHTLDHMMVSSARLIQFIDLVHIGAIPLRPGDLLQPDFVYVPLRLTARMFPEMLASASLAEIKPHVQPDLSHWVEQVALDGSCGLVTDSAHPMERGWRVHLDRWSPSRWRLRLAYPNRSLPTAAAEYAGRLLIHGLRSLGKRVQQTHGSIADRQSLALDQRRGEQE